MHCVNELHRYFHQVNEPNPARRNARQIDDTYFAFHPDELCYVRKILQGETINPAVVYAHVFRQMEWQVILVNFLDKEFQPLHPVNGCVDCTEFTLQNQQKIAEHTREQWLTQQHPNNNNDNTETQKGGLI